MEIRTSALDVRLTAEKLDSGGDQEKLCQSGQRGNRRLDTSSLCWLVICKLHGKLHQHSIQG
jgi:hypothetical protein